MNVRRYFLPNESLLYGIVCHLPLLIAEACHHSRELLVNLFTRYWCFVWSFNFHCKLVHLYSLYIFVVIVIRLCDGVSGLWNKYESFTKNTYILVTSAKNCYRNDNTCLIVDWFHELDDWWSLIVQVYGPSHNTCTSEWSLGKAAGTLGVRVWTTTTIILYNYDVCLCKVCLQLAKMY